MEKLTQEQFDDVKEIINLYKNSEHPINEVLSALSDNLWFILCHREQ